MPYGIRPMFRSLFIFAALAICVPEGTADAQDFRIVTTIRDLGAKNAQDTTFTTLTLFRQRKVYDYIDALGEVIIYEPGENQFTILNVRRLIATTVHFDEVKRLLGARKPEIQRYVARLRANNDPIADDVASAFEFQLNPKFEEGYDGAKNQLVLSSPKCEYRVQCAEVDKPELTAQYLAYADWMAQLNSVLHPGAMFPEPRIELNRSLRRHSRLPVRVELNSKLDGNLHISADHKISFALENRDRTRITQWEAALTSPRITRTTFQSYQEMVLTANR